MYTFRPPPKHPVLRSVAGRILRALPWASRFPKCLQKWRFDCIITIGPPQDLYPLVCHDGAHELSSCLTEGCQRQRPSHKRFWCLSSVQAFRPIVSHRLTGTTRDQSSVATELDIYHERCLCVWDNRLTNEAWTVYAALHVHQPNHTSTHQQHLDDFVLGDGPSCGCWGSACLCRGTSGAVKNRC